MSERMTDARFAEYEDDYRVIFDNPHADEDKVELWEALKAERKRIAELKAALTVQTEAKEMFNRMYAERGKRIEELDAIVAEQKRCAKEYQAKLKRVEKDCVDWKQGRITCRGAMGAIYNNMNEAIK